MLSDEQKKMRRLGVSASEASAVCGLNPYSGPIEVWQRKVGIVDDDISSQSGIIRGTLFEKPVAQWFCLLTGRTVVPQTTLRHAKYPLIMATPDGVTFKDGEDPRCLEIKCPAPFNTRTWGAPGTDEIDPNYLCQVNWQMAVTGLTMCDVVMFGGVEPQIYHVAYDDEFFHTTREICERFYNDYVVPKKAPPIDATPAYGEYLAQFAPMRDAKSTIDLSGSDDAERWIQQLKEAQKASKYWGSMEEEAKNNLKALMGENASARVPGGRITWRNTKQVRRIQWPELAKSLSIPSDVIEQHVKMGDAPRPFKVMWDKEEHA